MITMHNFHATLISQAGSLAWLTATWLIYRNDSHTTKPADA